MGAPLSSTIITNTRAPQACVLSLLYHLNYIQQKNSFTSINTASRTTSLPTPCLSEMNHRAITHTEHSQQQMTLITPSITTSHYEHLVGHTGFKMEKSSDSAIAALNQRPHWHRCCWETTPNSRLGMKCCPTLLFGRWCVSLVCGGPLPSCVSVASWWLLVSICCWRTATKDWTDATSSLLTFTPGSAYQTNRKGIQYLYITHSSKHDTQMPHHAPALWRHGGIQKWSKLKFEIQLLKEN